MGIVATIDRHLDALAAALGSVSPDQLTGPDAARLVERGVRLERLGVATRTRYAKRVADTGAYEASGHKDAANWLAGLSGESIGAAKGVLEVAQKLSEAPLVDQAFSGGQLSLAQAKVVAGAGAVDPSSQQPLLEAAEQGSFRELKDEVSRVKRRALGEGWLVANERRAYEKRYLKLWATARGGVRFEGLLPTVEGAKLKAAVEAEEQAVFKEAWAAGRRTAHEAHLADALVRVVTGRATQSSHLEVRTDAASLKRGSVQGDERCEIVGVGPIPVREAQALLSEGWVRLLVTNGTDVQTVTSKKRTIPEALRAAVHQRDGGRCVVPRCPVTDHLELDHIVGFAQGGPTSLDNLQLLCGRHHKMKTLYGFALVDGQWRGPP